MVIRTYGKFQAPRDGFPGIVGVGLASRANRDFDSNGPKIVDFDNFETLSSFKLLKRTKNMKIMVQSFVKQEFIFSKTVFRLVYVSKI